MEEEIKQEKTVEHLTEEIKVLLNDISVPNANTQRNDDQCVDINSFENPLDPNLLAYCFDIILGFDVRYRICEKVNYIIDFDYKGTFATVRHFKMSYRLSVQKKYRDEIIATFEKVHLLLEQLFTLIGEQALRDNDFSMKNESYDYFSKLKFYENRIESLVYRKKIIEEKCHDKFDIIEINGKYKCMRMKGTDYLNALESEITYDIEAYVDTFFSALEHVLTLLYPFTDNFLVGKSYYSNCIRNTKWHWEKKIQDVCGSSMPDKIMCALRRIKEVYRNHNTHGGFSREMMAYISKSIWYLTKVNRKKPYVVMLYGNSSLGKTQLVREIAKSFFKSKYMEKHLSMFKNGNYAEYFFGNEPNRSSIGFELLERESNLVFLDEIDKCPEMFYSAFYTLFDNTVFKDYTYDVDISGVLIILTANYTSMEEMKTALGLPIFYRIDKFIHFDDFSKENIYRITKKEIHDRKPEYSEFFTEEDLYKFVSPRIKVNGENARTIKNKIQFAIEELMFQYSGCNT